MKRILICLLAALCMALAYPVVSSAQAYEAPKVEISKEKVRYKGNVYYSHIVKERQTLYSICKAYNVTDKEIFEANPTLNLETEGLKKNQILLIPIKTADNSNTADTPAAKEENTSTENVQANGEAGSEKENEEDVQLDKKDSTVKGEKQQADESEYFFHTVKWYEDLTSIAKKYNVSRASIININGLDSQKLKRRQVLKIPRDYRKWEDIVPEEPEENTEEDTNQTEQVQEPEEPENTSTELPSDNWNREVHAAILLPFNASKASDKQLAMDFYSGVLLAARDLGKEDIKINLNAYDSENVNIPAGIFSSSDFVLGPILKADLAKAAACSNGESWIISPVDRMCEDLADSLCNFIQAPTSTRAQIVDAVSWLKSDVAEGDKVILIKQSGNTKGYGSVLSTVMSQSGIECSTVSASVLEAANLSGKIENLLSAEGTTRIITTADSESFMNQLVKSLYILSVSGKKIALYSNAKIRTFNTIETKQLHGVNLHASVASEVDYSCEETQEFTRSYRALYNVEPTHFAFQGYDLMRQFSVLVSKYGRDWHKAIDAVTMTGLQSNFNYIHNTDGGYSNVAAKRVIYAPDYSITVVE